MVNSLQPQPRQDWMATLAKAPLAALEQQLATLGTLPDYDFLRSPEIGLAMVRGRADSIGEPFNLGEMTITRCVVELPAATGKMITGFGYTAGRSPRHAQLAALCDALMQHPHWHAIVQAQVIEPLQTAAQAQQATAATEVESTRVNFFTMQRGDS